MVIRFIFKNLSKKFNFTLLNPHSKEGSKKQFALFPFLLIVLFTSCNIQSKSYIHGEKIDSLNHVYIYYNDGFSNVSSGRNVTKDGYNIGLKYQCVEFVKRYYYEFYQHKMPNTYGNAKDFFNKSLADGKYNADRDLMQYCNNSLSKPKIGDLVVYDESTFNSFGHVAIVCSVSEDEVEVIQQNCSSSRETYSLTYNNNLWKIDNDRILGWLRKR